MEDGRKAGAERGSYCVSLKESKAEEKLGSSFCESDLLYWVALSMVEHVGPRNARALLRHFEKPENIFRARERDLRQVEGIGGKIAKGILDVSVMRKAEAEIGYCVKRGVGIVHAGAGTYPVGLREADAGPVVLFQRGEMRDEKPAIAIVGTRTPTPEGRYIARYFAERLSESGFHIVSGMALGVDYEAHQACVDGGYATTGVLGHGFQYMYPQVHERFAEKMLERGGQLITEYASGVSPDARNFPARNRIIAGMCAGVLVVEAREKGGALITAQFAFEEGRQVYAVPGSPYKIESQGCLRLIQKNVAMLVMEPDDIVRDLELTVGGVAGRKQEPSLNLSADEIQAVRILRGECSGSLPPDYAAMLSTLVKMEVKGLVSRDGQGWQLRPDVRAGILGMQGVA